MPLSNERSKGPAPSTGGDVDRARDTPQRLRLAAARLLAERTWPEITLRDITEAAGANVASVGYHFGSKNALLGAVVHDAVIGTTTKRAALMDPLPADAPLERVVEVWLGPAFDAPESASTEDGLSWAVLRTQLGSSVPEVARAYATAGAIIERSLTSRLQRLLPHLDDRELRLRHVGVLAATAALTGRHPAQDVLPIDAPEPGDLDQLRRAVIAFACGALRAPAG